MNKNNIIWLIAILLVSTKIGAQNLSPYIKIGETQENVQQSYEKAIAALKENSFSILGAYNPEGKNSMKVIVFTRPDIKNTVVKVKDRGALAAAFKLGIQKKGNTVVLSYTNPEYLLRAYLMDNYNTYRSVFEKFDKDLKTALSILGNDFTPFGGTVAANKLKKYHYKVMMPYFTDPITLGEFASFEEGLKTIKNNLKAGKGNTVKVYQLTYTSKKVAVFGVGLKDKTAGEAHFMPIIGENHLAALPYEIILQDNKATMLHGRYRIALHWPALTMGTFMKIMNTPGDIEKALKGLCE